MPAKNPRLTITLQPSLSAQLRRLSELTGNSQSALISELLEGSGPTFDRLIQVLEAAQKAKDALKGGVSREMEDAQQRVEQQLGLVLDHADSVAATLLDEAEKVRRRRSRASGSAARASPARKASTPPSNRGVRSLTQTAKNQARTRG